MNSATSTAGCIQYCLLLVGIMLIIYVTIHLLGYLVFSYFVVSQNYTQDLQAWRASQLVAVAASNTAALAAISQEDGTAPPPAQPRKAKKRR